MMSRKNLMLTWCVGILLIVSLAWLARAQQATPSDREVARQGAIPLAAAYGEKPRYGGTFHFQRHGDGCLGL